MHAKSSGRILFGLLMLLTLNCASVKAEGQVEVFPRSESAESAFLQSTPANRLKLQLNRGNLVDEDLLTHPTSAVIFTRKGYLECQVPITPTFLQQGFPGDFTNLERFYELKIKTLPEKVKVYEVGRSSNQPSQKNYLGTTTAAPIRLDRKPYYRASKGDFSQVKLLFEKDNYESELLTLSAKELVAAKDLGLLQLEPTPGMASLWARRSRHIVAFGSGLLGIGLLTFLYLSRRTSSAPNTSSSLEQANRLGSYTLLESIGRGGTAEVYRATTPDGLEVALKLMIDSALEPEAKERFKREIQTSLKLEHPNLARTFDWGETEDGRFYLVSELLEGQTLSDRLKSVQVGAARDALISDALLGVAEALDYLHSQEVVHRDVKPGNIFLTSSGEAKLIDLGLVRGGELQALTRTGVAVGTPYYMSPEQSAGKYTKHSDQYALGVIAYEILTGTRPYRGKDPMEVFHQHLSAPVPSVGDRRPELGLHTASVVSKMMAKKPEQRFQSVLEALQSLATEFGDTPWNDEDTQAVAK